MKVDRKPTKPIGRGKSKTQKTSPTNKAVKPKPHEKKIERKQVEKKDLRASEEHFRALIENTSDMILIITADGNLNYVSPAAQRITGYQANEVIGRNIVEFIHADDLPLARQALASRSKISGLASHPIELRFHHKDGIWRIVEILGNNLLENPAVKGIVLNVRDITSRKQAEEELTIANQELAFQNEEIEKRAEELVFANQELAFQNEEKEKRAAEVVLANQELLFQNEEKEKRAAELVVANQELLFQNEEKEKRAAELSNLFIELKHSNAQLFAAYDSTIEGWSRALDLRDKETEGHSQRVTQMTVKLMRAFGLSETELVQVRWGALLHDIGKMGVPDGILLKPGSLTDEEWVLMRKHPALAYELLTPIKYLRDALDIPYCHHEKWDGTGYPRGLKGEQIPLAARIFAIVDVWDALTSDRPYRPAWPKEKAREHIRTSSGMHFDPQVVEEFLKMPN